MAHKSIKVAVIIDIDKIRALTTNAQLVERARQIIELMGARVLSPEEARKKFQLTKQV